MLSSRLTLLPPPPSLSVPPIRLPLVFSRRGGELVSNFHDYFCFPFLALCVLRFPLVAAAVPPLSSPFSSPPTLRGAVKFPAARAICSRTYLYFIIAEVFTLCLASSLSVPPSRRLVSSPLLLARSLASSRFSFSSYLLSCLLYDIYSVDERILYYGATRHRRNEDGEAGSAFSLQRSYLYVQFYRDRGRYEGERCTSLRHSRRTTTRGNRRRKGGKGDVKIYVPGILTRDGEGGGRLRLRM